MAKKNSLIIPKKSAKPSNALRRGSKSNKGKAHPHAKDSHAKDSHAKASRGHDVIHLQPKSNIRILKNVTQELIRAPGTLELYTTKSATSEQQINEQIIKKNEAERLKYFGVPIKIYEKGGEEGNQGQLSDDDKAELQLYGSRVVMDEEGRVLGLEVRKDLEHFTKGHGTDADYCNCLDITYEVSKKMEKVKFTRRCFMAKVLIIEAIIRLPALPFLYAQHHLTSVHNFTYTQPVFMVAICLLLLGSRIVSITCTKVGRYEPCRSVMLFITALSYAFNCATFNSAAQKYSIKDLLINEFEDPISLDALRAKSIQYPAVSFPYVVIIINAHCTIYSLVIAFILMVQPWIVNEFKNTYILLILLMAPGLAHYTHEVIKMYVETINTWHYMQQLVGLVCGVKWTMFRIYALQRVTRGKVMPVDETMYSFVALMFATSW